MDKIKILGLLLFVSCFLCAILIGGTFKLFINIPSILIVLGGAIGGTLLYKGTRKIPTSEVVFQFGRFALWSGVLGTIIGWVQMLANMSDPKLIGPAMAIGLLTTLYGMGAYAVCFAISEHKFESGKGIKAEVLAVLLIACWGVATYSTISGIA